MTDYSKLVEALRYCVSGVCKNCSYFEKCKKNGTAMAQLHNDAAAAIEELQAEQKKTVTQIFGEEQIAWEGRCKDLLYQIADLQAQLPKRGEWIENDNGTYSCNRCSSWIPNEQHYYARYCLYCGAKMEVQE